ncbi:MAG: hypothetical protein ACI8RD_012657, partial [Bacillariaceae sp.]
VEVGTVLIIMIISPCYCGLVVRLQTQAKRVRTSNGNGSSC